MKKLNLIFALAAGLAFAHSAFAAEQKIPTDCEGVMPTPYPGGQANLLAPEGNVTAQMVRVEPQMDYSYAEEGAEAEIDAAIENEGSDCSVYADHNNFYFVLDKAEFEDRKKGDYLTVTSGHSNSDAELPYFEFPPPFMARHNDTAGEGEEPDDGLSHPTVIIEGTEDLNPVAMGQIIQAGGFKLHLRP